MIGGFQPLAFQPAYQQVSGTPSGGAHYTGGWYDLPTGRRKSKKELRKEREAWGILPKEVQTVIKRVAVQYVEEPDTSEADTEALILAFSRAELSYKAQYAELYRQQVQNILLQMKEDEEIFLLLH